MDVFDRDRLAEEECLAVFASLFPRGIAGEDVVAEIAPEGWERSPLLAVFHPCVERRDGQLLEEGHREAVEAAKDRPPPPTVAAYRQVYGDLPRGWPPWD